MDAVSERLTKLIHLLKSGEPEALGYYLAILIVLKQSYIFRYLRRGVLPVGVVALGYRIAHGADYNLLQVVTKWLESSCAKCKRTQFLIFDLLGVITIAGMICTSEQLIGLLRTMIRQPNLKKTILNSLFEFVKPLPMVQKMIKSETESKSKELEVSLKAKTIEYNSQFGANTVLPQKGKNPQDILAMMHALAEAENTKWESGKVTGSVYHGSKSHQNLLNQAFGIYSLANPLHADIWPSGMKYESEIVAMTARLVDGGDQNVCGCTTSVIIRIHLNSEFGALLTKMLVWFIILM
jgi:hypothetical protein